MVFDIAGKNLTIGADCSNHASQGTSGFFIIYNCYNLAFHRASCHFTALVREGHRRAKSIKRTICNGGTTIPALTSGPQRFFYHSFPRRRGKEEAGEVEKGLTILRLLKEMGPLLTPEITEWPEVLSDGSLSDLWSIAQKRCCFTELTPAELPQHAEVFGHFAIEFDIPVLRSLGAIPVFYLPRTSETKAGLEVLSTAFVACIGEIDILLGRLSEVERLVRSNVNKDEMVMQEIQCSVGAAEDLLTFVTEGNKPLESLQALSGLFYPAEDLKYTDLLGYYRQREWRILGNMAKDGLDLTHNLDRGEVVSLMKLDTEFFGQQLLFRTGPYLRVEQCKLFDQLDGKLIIRYARRAIAPEVAVAIAKKILNEPDDPPVVALESLER